MSLFWYRKRVEALAAGTLEGAEERKVRDHVRGCDACRAHYDRAVKVRLAVGGAAVRRERDDELLARLPFPGPAQRPTASPSFGVWVPVFTAALIAVLVAVIWHPWSKPADEGLRGGDDPAAPLQVRLYREQQSGKAELLAELPGTATVRVSKGERVQLSARGAGDVTAKLYDTTFTLPASTGFVTAAEAWTIDAPAQLVVTDAAGHRVTCRIELAP